MSGPGGASKAARARLVDVEDTRGWQHALGGLPFAFGHQPGAVRAAARLLGARPALWSCEADGRRAACPVLLRRDACGFDVATPAGFAGLVADGPMPALAPAWSDDWRARGAIAAYVQAAPWFAGIDEAAWLAHGGAWNAGPDCLAWNLLPAPDALLSGMAPKHRQLLRKWLREDARVAWEQDELREAFAPLYAGFLARTPVAPPYRHDAASIALLADAPGAFFVGARDASGALEAITLFGHADGRGDSLLNAATVAGRRHSRGLYWLGALRLRELDVRELNLGGGIGAGDGLEDFKVRLGAVPRATRVLRQVFDRAAFEAACSAAGASPGDAYFPPWRRPRA
jgi:hypothetical protein